MNLKKINNSLLNSLPLQGKEATKSGFTLVELIVVITILAILGTIAFISLQGYSANSRDSVRISDMSSIKSSLELFNIDAGKYPNTSSGTDITFSGGTVRTQGTFGESTYKNVTKLDKIPKDPLTDIEYTYSVTNTAQEYEIAGIMEGDNISMLNETYAAQKTAKAMVSGHYNGKIAKVFTDGKTYVLAVPTIISGSGFTLEEIMANKSFVYNGYSNLPLNYNGSSYNTLGETNLNLVDANNYIVYSGSLENLTNPKDATARIQMLQNLQTAYTGSVIKDSAITEILAITDFSDTNPIAVNLAGTVVNNTLGASIATSTTGNTGTTPQVVVDTTPPTDYIAYYPLTGTAEDKTGNYNGTEVGNTYVSDTNRGSVARFDGLNSVVSIPKYENENFTFSMWINLNSYDNLYSLPLWLTNRYGFNIQNITTNISVANKITFAYFDGTSWKLMSSVNDIQLNTWYHITATGNSSKLELYINGNLDDSIVQNSLYTGPITTKMAIGGGYYGTDDVLVSSNGMFDGKISNVHIYNRALSSQEITNIYNAEKDKSSVAVSNGLVAYYPLKNNSQDNWYNQYDMNQVNASYDTQSMSLAGFPDTGEPLGINFGDLPQFGLSFWYKNNTSTINYPIIFLNGNTSVYDQQGLRRYGGTIGWATYYYLSTTTINLGTNYYPNTSGTIMAFSGADDGNWHLLSVSSNGPNQKGYVDGTIVFDITKSYNMSLQVGSSNGLRNDSGNLANLRIYNKSLIVDEISEIYNTEKGDFGL